MKTFIFVIAKYSTGKIPIWMWRNENYVSSETNEIKMKNLPEALKC